MTFPHEDLSVYRKSLAFFSDTQRCLTSWSKQHALVDHLARATESILFNLVEAVRIRENRKKTLTLDYAVGSTFECAGCLDIAVIKGLLDGASAREKKTNLLEVSRMLIGLRNSWAHSRVKEDRAPYGAAKKAQREADVFHHERLDMYAVALEFCRWLISTKTGQHLGTAFAKTVDSLATRVVLHIAEGNGRYAQLSRHAFLDSANGAAAKLAACLDMGLGRGLWSAAQIEQGKRLLIRVGQMTAGGSCADSETTS